MLSIFPNLQVNADEDTKINNNDIKIIQIIYNENTDLLDWDITEPLNIENTEWDIFDGNYCLTSLDLSSTDISGNVDLSLCEHIKYCDFSDTNIESIILPNSINSISTGAFRNCVCLEYMNIPQNISLISNKAFQNCSELKSVVLNGNIDIQSEVFLGCVSLNCIVNANFIESVGRNAFGNCDELIFYCNDNDIESLYISNYAYSYGYDCNNIITGQASGYTGIMYSIKNQTVDLTTTGKAYIFATAYLYDDNSNLLSVSEVNEEGLYSFDNLTIGYRYRLVLDGNTAIPRSEYFVVTCQDYSITTQQDAYAVAVWDFNRDGLITNTDKVKINQAIIFSSSTLTDEEKVLCDIDGSGSFSTSDTQYVYYLMNIKDYYE